MSTTKNYGAAVSGYRDPSGRSYETVVVQAGKPILDTELNLIQDLSQNSDLQRRRRTLPSGWVSDNYVNSYNSDLWVTGAATANLLRLTSLLAHVNGWLLPVTNTNDNTGLNVLDLGSCPSGAGVKRTDLVVLEVWRRLLPASPTTTGKSSTGRIWQNGNVKIASGDNLTLNFADDILDVTVGSETSKRVQIQYRLRVIQGVDIFTYAYGINDPAVVANSVPASAGAPDGVATAFTFSNQSAAGDAGMWVAGDGNPANTLGTIDGYMYALPLCAVFRRNTTAFARNTNCNGGTTYPTASTRPDGLYSDIIVADDIFDLRFGVSFTGWDLAETYQKNVSLLLANSAKGEISTTTLGGGMNGHTVLWADEIGITNAHGGDGTTTGDTPAAVFVGEFDGVRRTFADYPTYETVVLKYTPSSTGVSPGGATWTNSTSITIDADSLLTYLYTGMSWRSYAASNVYVVDVLGVAFSSASSGKFTTPKGLQMTTVFGIGQVPMTFPIVAIETTTIPGTAHTITNEDIYITLLVCYPSGGGLSKTPTGTFNSIGSFVKGVQINNPAQLPVGAPTSFASLADPTFNQPNRGVRLEYKTTSQTFSMRGGADAMDTITMPEMIDTSQAYGITINGGAYAGSVTFDGYNLILAGGSLSAANCLVVVTYFALRAIPINNVQCTVYYNARTPQTIREGLLPVSLNLNPKFIPSNMLVVIAGSGADGAAVPYPYAYVQSGGVYPTSLGTFVGDHSLDGPLHIGTPTITLSSGFLQVPLATPLAMDGGTLQIGRTGGDSDVEGRTFYKTTTGNTMRTEGTPFLHERLHKDVVPVLCELTADNTFGFKGEMVLVLFSRWATFDTSNSTEILSSLTANSTTASVFRLKGNLLNGQH